MTYAEKAEAAAYMSPGVRGARVGACAVRGQATFTGWNSWTTHPKQAHFARNPFSIYLHAEVAAMVRAKWEVDTLVVVRILADGSWGLAKPCKGCQRALTNVHNVWYSTGTGHDLRHLYKL